MVLYRSAGTGTRDVILAQGKLGKPLDYQMVDQWNANNCPMSSMAVVGGQEQSLSWQTKESVFYAFLDEKGRLGSKAVFPEQGKLRKHSVLARNNDAALCLAWTEGMSWNKGGTLLWEAQDATGKQIVKGKKADLPAWSRPAVAVKPNGDFLIVY